MHAPTSRLLAAALAVGLITAPAALAQQAPAKPHAGMGMTAEGASVPFLVHHAYTEAVHANEAVVMGMADMATNHLENVGIVLGGIDLSRDVADAKVRQQLGQIRDQARGLTGAPSLSGTQQLVGKFVGLVATMPMPRPGGGGGGQAPLTPMLHMPAELAAMAVASAANTQVDAAQRNFDGARLHAQHAVASLDAAIASARLHKTEAGPIDQLTGLKTRAASVLQLVQQRSPRAVGEAGELVTRIGSALPALHGAGAKHQDEERSR